ncbi:PREDICTED: tetratricopeptide repeat protein 27 [Nicrophorus vespilloides]|uniref:Tetratricopeptide repeat protein 27 n=1 Tax=Nicrophorus vespilloides TaxID=110193 RepID=A0ABM1N237_NICVS|nr:PREDICTED: tetratricopeptide repeat protein 27 [Nicrophorus vespilloides]
MAQNGENVEYLRRMLLEADGSPDSEKEIEEVLLDIKDSHYWLTLKEHNYCNSNLKRHFETKSEVDREKFFRFAISCISTFVQANFTGPPINDETDHFLCNNQDLQNVDFRKLLAVSNEEININTKYPSLLIASQVVFKTCELIPTLNLWWQWRGLLVHQRILEELSPALLSNAENIQKDMRDLHLTESGNLGILMNIEQAQLFGKFRSIAKVDQHIKAAAKSLGLKHELIGKMGKRTKHQENDIPQLSLKVELERREGLSRHLVTKNEGPINVALNDDVRLETVEFADKNEAPELSDLEQKLLLLVAQHMIMSKPQDDLYFEELKPFIDTVLSQNNTWCVAAYTLQLRCNLEAKHNRTIERCLIQCEEVLNSVKKENPPVIRRITGCYNTSLNPIWMVEETYAHLMLNLGLIKASLEVYMKLQLWEEVIVCYTILKMRHKATEIIKKQLNIRPTVKLYCLLGDATDDLSCYAKAWEFSKRRSHRAQRHWGLYYFIRKKYAECIPHFEKSVSINPLQAIVWLRLGFAALETQNWQIAATAYRRYTTLEPDGFEAWNNLAQAYIRLGNKRSAHHALQDALRCNFDNWKVWENFLVVSADIDNYSDVIRSYHKLLDLKGKYTNIDVLKVLVYGVCNENNAGDKALMKKTRELLGRATSIFPGDGILWELYACVAPILMLKIQRLQRALRGFTQGSWTNDIEVCKHVLYICLKLGEAVMDDSISSKDTIVNSVKLNINAIIPVVKVIDNAEILVLLQEVVNVVTKIMKKMHS